MGMRIDKTKAEKVQKPFRKEEKGWLDSAVDSVKEFFTPSEDSYANTVSKGLKDFKKIKSGELPAPTITPTATTTITPTVVPEVGVIDQDHVQNTMAKRFFLQGLGLNWEPDEEDLRPPVKEVAIVDEKPKEDDYVKVDDINFDDEDEGEV